MEKLVDPTVGSVGCRAVGRIVYTRQLLDQSVFTAFAQYNS